MQYIIISIVSVVVIIVASVAAGFTLINHEYKERTKILESTQASPRMALVVYQPSITPASSDVAHAIAKGLNDSGFEVKLTTPGKHLSTDISAYSVVVFGSPNYGGSVAVALSNYVDRIDDFSGKTIILFTTSGRIDNMLELEKLALLLHDVTPYEVVKFEANDTEHNKAVAYQLGVDTANQ